MRSLLYISQGNVPSKWAHTFQAMRMAEALAPFADEFAFVTRGHWLDLIRPRFDFESWYGIREPFPIVRLTSRHAQIRRVQDVVWAPGFDRDASRYVRRRKPDLVFTRDPRVALACARLGQATVLENHATPPATPSEPMVEAARRDAVRAVVTISPELAEIYEAEGVPRDKLIVWPDAVNPAAFSPDRSPKSAREELGLPADGYLAVYCGHLYPDRGVEEILLAARELPDVSFVLAGGWEKDVAARRTESRDLPNVQVPGFVPNGLVPAYLAAADVVLLPYSSRVSTVKWMSPLKLFEAMAAGRPLISTRLPAIERHLEDGRNSLLVPPDDATALAAVIERLRADPAAARALAARARHDVAGFTWEQRARDILGFVGWDLDGDGGPVSARSPAPA